MSEHKHQHVEFQFGDKASGLIDERARWKLALNLIEGTHNMPDSFIGKLRNTLRDLLSQAIPRHQRSYTKWKILQAISPFLGKREKAGFAAEGMKTLQKEGQMVTATVDGELAGAGGFLQIGTHPTDGKPVFAMQRGSVFPKFRGRGIGSQLMKLRQFEIQRIQPDAHILMETKTQRVKQWCISHGYREIPFEEVIRFHGGKTNADELLELQKQGWTGFLLSPEKKED
ncbi:MAG: GNAT family N-acetyltransferase [Candidatus Peribacteraceae bacterium]|nr:GNAT family N-acetyltransferase [Candidatus Peribacteraceae bacterium]